MIRREHEARFERITTARERVENPSYVDKPDWERWEGELRGKPEPPRHVYEERQLDRPFWQLYGRNDQVLLSVTDPEGSEIANESESIPAEIDDDDRGRIWWLYKGAVYSTKEDLEPDEVLALIDEKANKKRIAIARAKAVAAMAESLDRKGERQPIPREIKVAVWQRDQGRCVECGSKVELEFDHIVPLALGGSNTERNIQLLCANCNRAKGASL